MKCLSETALTYYKHKNKYFKNSCGYRCYIYVYMKYNEVF